MKFAVACSTVGQTVAAADQITAEVRDALGTAADLAVVFISHHHRGDAQLIGETIHEVLAPACLIGCTAQGIIAGRREYEDSPAAALLAARLPGVAITPLRLTGNDLAQKPAQVVLPDCGLTVDRPQTLILLPDPFSTPPGSLLDAVNAACPGWPVVGGMASGATQELDNLLLLNGEIYRHGAVGVALSGRLQTHVVVSQGCRPIGPPLVITKAKDNIIHQLAGRPAVQCIHELLEALSPHERSMASQGLLLGRAVTAQKRHLVAGDFLVRNILRLYHDDGAIAVGDFVRPGQTVQFHVRDAASADRDLRNLLERFGPGHRAGPPAGVLCFSCNGRGTHLFCEPDHDSKAITSLLGPVPLLGHFAAGEIGPVGGQTFLHGHTASIALFYPVE